MKKSIYKLAFLLTLVVTSSIFAQDDPGADPDVAMPIDSYLWVLLAIGLVYVFFKLRTSFFKKNIVK